MIQPSIYSFWKDRKLKRIICVLNEAIFEEREVNPNDKLKVYYSGVGFTYFILNEARLTYIMTLQEFHTINYLGLRRYEQVFITFELFK